MRLRDYSASRIGPARQNVVKKSRCVVVIGGKSCCGKLVAPPESTLIRRRTMMFEPDAESMPAEQLAALQEDRLRGLVDRLLAADGVQAERLRSAGVTSGGGVALSDLPQLPMTEKKDFWDAYPLRMLGVDRSEVVALHGSSGTGGRPTLVGYTRSDLRLWARMCARALAAAGA